MDEKELNTPNPDSNTNSLIPDSNPVTEKPSIPSEPKITSEFTDFTEFELISKKKKVFNWLIIGVSLIVLVILIVFSAFFTGFINLS